MNFAALVSQATTSTIAQGFDQADWDKYSARFSAASDTSLDLLRAELSELTGAPCSPSMTAATLHKKIVEARRPAVVATLDHEAQVTARDAVKPSKPQGIGAAIVTHLKAGLSPQATLAAIHASFDDVKTTIACVYWYKSKINQGKL